MIKKIAYFLLMAFPPLIINCQSIQENVKGSFNTTFTISKKTTHKINKKQKYTFGYLEVPENRQDSNSQTIKIPVYIFKSRSKSPKKDPIIYTVGGPGQTTMPSAQYMEYYKYLDDRDFILIEQRGNYYAKPHLDCPELAKATFRSNLPDFDETEYDVLVAKATKDCRNRLAKKGIDFDGYNTNEIAADINDLVNILEIEKYNLLTISYSTKIAQVLMRDYPKKIRSIVMDSPLPLESNYDEESVKNLLETVDKLLSDCEANEGCNNAFPKIKTRFYNYLKEKTEKPLEVKIDNPNNGKIETFNLTGADLIGVFTIASTEDIVNIPYEINKLLSDDLTSVKEQLSYLFQESNYGSGLGMRLSVWCAEEYPFSSQSIIKTETTKYPEVKGLSSETFEEEICKIWGVQKVSEIEDLAVKSDIPVLLINGEYDNLTPPKWANSMSNNLVNSYQFVFKGWKHTPTTNWGNPCAMILANEFFNNPKEKPNSDCFEQIGSPEFKTE
ncbi:alpha/beta fold hydrolase [Croceitalea vernalis]|uniref:Alpha/beta fold hydrolase n=1 Tax=Croceitalea vernalis TaxID=3075599 RepID=A0ABU3BKJ6_9FLAO|nr:alpha/beta fold hydrolase [Croceitalea sp. P007]MDT0622693.1 alpha/beta fold hydrolase [Croceitalea sp. P007]